MKTDDIDKKLERMRQCILEFQGMLRESLQEVSARQSKQVQIRQHVDMVYKVLQEKGKITRKEVKLMFSGVTYNQMSYIMGVLGKKPDVEKRKNTYHIINYINSKN